MNKITTKVKALYGTINQTLSVTEKYEAVNSFYIYTRLYSNGTQASYLNDAGQPFYGTNGSHLLVKIPQYSENWAGEYTVVSYAHCHDVVYTLLQGCGYSHHLICHNLIYKHVFYFFWAVLQTTITTLGKKVFIVIHIIYMIFD